MTQPPDSLCDQLEAAREFASEVTGYIDTLRTLLIGEQAPDIGEVFRLFHTIKGTAGFSGLPQVETLAHATEKMLDALRDTGVAFSAPQHNALETSVETLARMTFDLATIGNTQSAPKRLLTELSNLTSQRIESASPEFVPANESAYYAMELTGAAPTSNDGATLAHLLEEAGIDVSGPTSHPPSARSLEDIFLLTRKAVLHAAQSVEKVVRFECTGGDIWVSGNLDTALSTTLLHTTRNAVGHGIEPSDERVKLGKPVHGTVKVHARVEASILHVRIEDDGQGLDIENIVAQAARKGIFHKDLEECQASQNLAQLIFLPGLSTCDRLSSLSGMGVGMDAVRHAVINAGGHIRVESEPGMGTQFFLTFPADLCNSRTEFA